MRVWVVVCVFAGCGFGSAKVTGTVAGIGLSGKDAIASSIDSAYVVVVYDRSGACSEAQNYKDFPSDTELSFIVEVPNGQSVSKGSYPIVVGSASPLTSGVASVQFIKRDAQCKGTLSDAASSATSGTVSVTNIVAGESVSGTFDVHFDSGDHLTGSFDAPFCSIPQPKVQDAPGTCG